MPTPTYKKAPFILINKLNISHLTYKLVLGGKPKTHAFSCSCRVFFLTQRLDLQLCDKRVLGVSREGM